MKKNLQSWPTWPNYGKNRMCCFSRTGYIGTWHLPVFNLVHAKVYLPEISRWTEWMPFNSDECWMPLHNIHKWSHRSILAAANLRRHGSVTSQAQRLIGCWACAVNSRPSRFRVSCSCTCAYVPPLPSSIGVSWGSITVGLASHWPCVTGTMVYPHKGSTT